MPKQTEPERIADVRRRLLEAALREVPFDGWSWKALAAAAEAAGYDGTMARRAFPGGPAELIEYFVAEADRTMLTALEQCDVASMRAGDRIAMAIQLRLEHSAPHREAIRRAVAYQALPGQGPRALAALYRTVDAIWRAVGDTSTDWNFYSKRLLLAGVYSSTLLYWLDDASPDFSATWEFLDRRMEDVMRVQKVKGRLAKLFGRLAKGPVGAVSRYTHAASRRG